jgi:hypothetical protein
MEGSRSSPVLVFALYAACIFGLPELAQAQNGTNAVTDPAEGISLSLSLSLYLSIEIQFKSQPKSFQRLKSFIVL